MTRLWAYDQLSARPTGIGRPPWDERGGDDYLPAATSTGGENETEPLAEQTMGPLLIWAMRLVDFADDILAAWAETCRLIEAAHTATGTPEGRAAAEAFLAPLLATDDAALPAVHYRGEIGFATTYVSGITGASTAQLDNMNQRYRLTRTAARRPGPCPLDVPVTGRIAGAPWRQNLDFTEAPVLMRHLGTAAFVVCAYLTGMRTGEKRAMLHWMQHSSRPNNGKPAGQTMVSDQLAA